MNQILKIGQTVKTSLTNSECVVDKFLGGGGQGEVYRASVNGKPMALKWYFAATATPEQKEGLEVLVEQGPPTDKFLWPLEMTSAEGIQGYGYIMPLRESQYKSIVDLMKGRIDPSFRALALAGYQLADSYFQLHAKGLCYRDISFGNVFFDPDSGDILICDNDNVSVDGLVKGILGTQRFMAPEVVRGEAMPSIQTDLFSLAVLLFYMFMIHHPLEGKKETLIRCLDAPAMTKLYGTDPLFIFDPSNDDNRPDPLYHQNVLTYWPMYPQFLQDLFIQSFVDGIKDPQNGRVRESQWKIAMIKLMDSIIYCGNCGTENFYDAEALKVSKGKPGQCWQCQKDLQLPFRMRIGNEVVMLNYDTKLYPHHIDKWKKYDLSQPAAEVIRHPSNPNIWGLKNLSQEKWIATGTSGTMQDIEPGKSITLVLGTKIQFGNTDGEIRL